MSASISKTNFAGVRVVADTNKSFDDVLSGLQRLTKKASIPELNEQAQEQNSQEDFVRYVEEHFVGESGFMLFAELNHGVWIKKFGINRRTVRWIFGNPLIAITMIKHDISAGLFVPVELLLTEKEDGNGCTLTYVLPSSLIAPEASKPELREAAVALDKKFEALVVAVT